MNKKKCIIIASGCICVCLMAALMFLLQPKERTENSEEEADKMVSLEQAQEQFPADIQELKDGKYPNLVSKNFTASIEDAKALYNFQILNNTNYETTIENVDEMIKAMEKFFGDSFNKSDLYHNAYPLDENGEVLQDAVDVRFSYDELMTLLKEGKDEQYWLIGGFGLSGDYYAHTNPGFSNTWFSKKYFGTSLPVDNIYNECLYVTGMRQEDAVVQLLDGEFQLEELEQKVLDYVNGENFPLPIHKEISYDIGKVYIMTYEEGECINFALRRVYEGVPFEYGSASSSGGYTDKVDHDYTTLSYAESTSPDTIMGFIALQGIIDEKEEITKMLTVGEALSLLSERIGENSIYEVHGVELVYRNCEVPEDKIMEISDILEPKWKIITINQNDDKYTLFYVDVVTGEITNRFEYYYD